MYNIFFSKIEDSIDNVKNELKKVIDSNSKVAIFPWAFPKEINSYNLINDFFKKDGPRYKRYIDSLKKIGLKEENFIICDCYNDSTEKLREIIKKSDILFFPGGNPEMLFSKIVQQTEILYDIKHFKGVIIGESAGTELQLKRYFIMAENNYYKYFAFYDGFGVLDDPFYIDVHTINDPVYLKKLQEVANEKNKIVYAIYNDGCMVYNRKIDKLIFMHRVDKFIPYNQI